MNTLRKSILCILMLVICTRAYGALYFLRNGGVNPITVKLDIYSNDKLFDTKQGTMTIENLKPGETRQGNAGGGEQARVIYLVDPKTGMEIGLQNEMDKRGDYRGKYYNEKLRGDQDISFDSHNVSNNRYAPQYQWTISIVPHYNSHKH